MAITISDHLLHQANMSEEEFKLELGLFLFEKRILTQGKAAEFAGVSQFEFQKAMSQRDISISYDEEEFERDYRTVIEKNSEA